MDFNVIKKPKYVMIYCLLYNKDKCKNKEIYKNTNITKYKRYVFITYLILEKLEIT